ncbi:MAG: hypothetical protein WD035_03365 [Balneolaceae bacterium]
MENNNTEQKEHSEWRPRYWLVAGIGILYILLLGLFTWFFNQPG